MNGFWLCTQVHTHVPQHMHSVRILVNAISLAFRSAFTRIVIALHSHTYSQECYIICIHVRINTNGCGLAFTYIFTQMQEHMHPGPKLCCIRTCHTVRKKTQPSGKSLTFNLKLDVLYRLSHTNMTKDQQRQSYCTENVHKNGSKVTSVLMPHRTSINDITLNGLTISIL